MADKLSIRKSDRENLSAVQSLLVRSGLPTAGLHDTRLFVLEIQGSLRGVVGYEVHGPYALLRSLAVDPSVRGRGYGRELLLRALGEIGTAGFRAAYALTATIPEWLTRRGFREVARHEVPQQLGHSAELQGSCCASARVFVLELERAEGSPTAGGPHGNGPQA